MILQFYLFAVLISATLCEDSNDTDITQELIGPVETAAIVVSAVVALVFILNVLIITLRCRKRKRNVRHQTAEGSTEPEKVLTEKEDLVNKSDGPHGNEMEENYNPLRAHSDEKQDNTIKIETAASTTTEVEGVVCQDTIAKDVVENTVPSESDTSSHDSKSGPVQPDCNDKLACAVALNNANKSEKTEKPLNYIEVDIKSEKPAPPKERKVSKKREDTVKYSTVLVDGSAPPTILDPVHETSKSAPLSQESVNSKIEPGTQRKDYYDL